MCHCGYLLTPGSRFASRYQPDTFLMSSNTLLTDTKVPMPNNDPADVPPTKIMHKSPIQTLATQPCCNPVSTSWSWLVLLSLCSNYPMHSFIIPISPFIPCFINFHHSIPLTLHPELGLHDLDQSPIPILVVYKMHFVRYVTSIKLEYTLLSLLTSERLHSTLIG